MENRPPEVTPFPQSRLSTIDLGHIGVRKHHVAALLEVDVTKARSGLRMANRRGRSTISFLAWLVKNVASSLAEYPNAHAVRMGKRSIATFASVNVSIMVERNVDGSYVPLPLLIPNADSRAVEDIEAQIAVARQQAVQAATVVLGKTGSNRRRRLSMALYYALPGFIRRWLLKRALANPARLQHMMGSVVITSVGMGGRVKGWFIPKSMHPVCIGIGAVTPKAVVLNGRIEAREVLHMTVLVDHDVVDGAPASRWISTLVRAMENGAEISVN
jgi:pyruvate/2-oxoglutarate dehydrogenase complex dihydrolipoamide acyltransferase (E2) component